MGVDEAEVAAVAGAQLRSASRVGVLVGIKRVHEGASGVRLAIALQELLEHLEGFADILLGDMSESVDLTESSGNIRLSACYENASSDHRVLGLALEVLGVVGHLEDVLGGILNRLGNIDRIAEVTNFAIGGKKSLGGFIVLGSVLGAVQLSRAHALTKADTGLELRTVQEWVDRVTDTGRIVIALIIVGEGSPLRAGVDNAIAEDEATRATDHVAR